PVQQPAARSMAAMVCGRKLRLRSIFAFQQSRRMRDPNEEHCVLASIGCRLAKGAPRMLLEHIVNVLHARHVPLADAIGPLVEPADRGSQGDAIIANFSFGL